MDIFSTAKNVTILALAFFLIQSVSQGSQNLCFPVQPIPVTSWRGEYFSNRELSGTPAMIRDDGAGKPDFEWGLESPSESCGIPKDNFSVRWTRRAAFSEGTWIFNVTVDDGVRIYIDRQLKLEKWLDQRTTLSFTTALTGGNHDIVIEYFDHWGSASIKVDWREHPCFTGVSPYRWKGEYFTNATLHGSPVMIRDDGETLLNFVWGTAGPSQECGIPADDFSVRWSRRLLLNDGLYRFSITADDGVRFFVDGRKALDQWRNQQKSTFNVDLSLYAGAHTIVLEYYEHTGEAITAIDWQMIGVR